MKVIVSYNEAYQKAKGAGYTARNQDTTREAADQLIRERHPGKRFGFRVQELSGAYVYDVDNMTT